MKRFLAVWMLALVLGLLSLGALSLSAQEVPSPTTEPTQTVAATDADVDVTPAPRSTLVQFLSVLGLAMVPFIELRGSILLGQAFGLNLYWVYAISVLGSILPCPFIIIFGERLLKFFRENPRFTWFRKPAIWAEKRAMNKAGTLSTIAFAGLLIFVAIPLPGTGVWMGSLIASLFHMRLRDGFFACLLGTMTAGLIMCLVAFGIWSIPLPRF